jgi:superfamily II DNA or RNA helicase
MRNPNLSNELPIETPAESQTQWSGRRPVSPPASEPSGLRPGQARPRVQLHVFSDDCTVLVQDGLKTGYETRSLPLLRLTFDWGTDLPDARVESSFRRVLEAYGVVELETLEDCSPAPGVLADYMLPHEGTVHDFCGFVSDVVPQLRARGFEVTVDQAHRYKVVAAPAAFYADVSDDEEEPNWFSVEFGVEVDGKRVPILATLLGLLDETSSLDGLRNLFRGSRKTIAVPVSDGVYMALPVEKVRAMLRVLSELYEWQNKSDDSVRFHKSRATALADFESSFGEEDASSLRFYGDLDVLAQARALSTASLESDVPPEPEGLCADLRGYQKTGLAWLCMLRRCGVGGVLADDMGLGKTLQIIAYLCVEKARGSLQKPALVVAPTSLVPNWAREAKKFAPHLNVVTHHGADRHESFADLRGADVIVTSYPVVTRDEEALAELGGFSTIVLDEAQTIKNDKSRANRSVAGLPADHRLCLTGTPVENNLGELWSIFDFACPGLLGDELRFSRQFRMPIEREKNEERLVALRRLVAPYILRRTKAEVLTELPPKTELRCPVEIHGEQRDLYESIRVAAHEEVRRLIKAKGLAASTIPILGALTKLRQVCCDPALVSLADASQVRVSAKREAFERMVSEKLREGHRILVFSQFTSMLDLLAESLARMGVAHATITGSTMDRAREVDRFESGEVPVFLISLRAGGCGLTLTSADTVIHYDPWWNPAVQAQATDRAYRMGQKKEVFVHHLFVAGSVEERILRMQKKKKHVADAILGAAAADGMLTESDVELLLSPLAQ